MEKKNSDARGLKKKNIVQIPNLSNTHYETLGTLGNKFTCSYDAATKFGKAEHIFMFPTFDDASEAVKSGKIQALWIPGAYPMLGVYIMDDTLKVQETVIIQIPSLVLSGKFIEKPKTINKLYMHPAVTHLLKEVDVKYNEKILVNSNPEACENVLKYHDDSIAITNRNSAEYYELEIYKVLREGIFMPFILFVRN